MATSTTYLERTFAAGDRRKWTWSAWVKRANLGSNNWLFHTYLAGNNENSIFFTPDDQLAFSIYTGNNDNGRLTTNRKFRDTNAWYHLQFVWDSANSTAGNRMRIYVNGVEETSFATDTNPPINYEAIFNSAINHTIGQYGNNDASMRFSGSMSHVHFSDGYALAPTVFGEYDANGVWKIKTSPSFTLGTNGFTILKDGNTITDQSSNSNNWSASGTLTKTEDCPSNVFATLNPLSTPSTLSNGNLQAVYAGSGSYATASSTLGMTSGKFYCEVKLTLTNNYPATGICATNSSHATTLKQTDWLGSDADSYGIYTSEGKVYNIGNVVNTFGAISTGDILGMALDLDSAQNTLKYYKNGSLIGTQNITTNSNGWMFGCTNENTGSTNAQFNFGNGYFGTTAVSSAGTNASGIGIFEYDVPTGYTALSTKGLNL
ncbi:hypothetical protein N8990_05265 [Candidatus Pelagibacter sp.]|nr:hypothetical protein [Candidatus Pelagibacter sp.]